LTSNGAAGAPPLFSVVLPTRNRPELFREAVCSVLRQTIADWELVVVDDASDVPVDSLVEDPRIVFLRMPKRCGPAAARNAGVAASSGTYVTFLDDDDLYTPDRLEIATEGLQHAPIATCWMRYLDLPTGNNVTLTGDVSDSILDQMTPPVGATALHRQAYEPFDERWRGVEDIEWWLRMAQRQSVTTVPRVGYLFRRWHDPSSPERAAQLRQRIEENRLFLKEHADYFDAHRRAAAFRLKRIGLMLLLLQDRGEARRALLHSMTKAPKASTAWHIVRTVRAYPSDRR
jgi:glycosyltransferase involved in cell wall biosynthesis